MYINLYVAVPASGHLQPATYIVTKHFPMVILQERLASEVAAVESRKQGGKTKPAKGGSECVATSQSTQTDMDMLPAETPSTIEQLDAELSVLQAELRSKEESLATAHTLHIELRAAHETALKQAESVQAENIRLIEQLSQAQSDSKAQEQLCTQLAQEINGINLQLKQLQAQHSELQSQHALLKSQAESLQASEPTHNETLQSMTQRAKAALDHALLLEASKLATAQQLNQLQNHSLLLEQTQEELHALFRDAIQHVKGAGAESSRGSDTGGSLVSAAKALIECMQHQTEEAEAEAVKVAKQLQEAQAACALQVEQLRWIRNQLGWPCAVFAHGLVLVT